MSESNEWLKNLKAGDTVVVQHDGHHSHASVKSVDRITPTQVIVGTAKYKRNTGREVGGDKWYRNRICEATTELLAKIRSDNRRAFLVRKLSGVFWYQLPLETLEAIDALLVAQAAKDAPEVAETEKQ